jgi:integrase
MEDLHRYCARHPVGTKAHLAVALLLFTGVRRGDVMHLGRQHIRNGVIEYQANKNDAPLFIPIPGPLAYSIEMATVGDMIFLTSAKGTPFKSSASFGNWFRDRCNEAGVSVRAHGLRKLAATIIADNEGSEKQLQAFFGWKSDRQSAVYTKTANARKLAQSAALKLIGNSEAPNLMPGLGSAQNN